MAEKLTKEFAQKLMKIKGECRGITLKVDWDYVLRKEGKEGLKRLEERLAELGYPLKYKEIRSMDFYPIGLDALSMLVIKELFHYNEKEIERMGASAVKFSLILKIFLKYFGSLSMMIEEAPKVWNKHYTIGRLEASKINDKEGFLALKLFDFKVHPIFCIVFKGYFGQVGKMVLGKEVNCVERKCMFLGDPYHEFLLKWK